MMNYTALKIAGSALAIVATMVACKPAAQAYRVASASTKAPKPEEQAIAFYAKAQASVQKGDLVAALPDAERAVELSPRDSGFRMLLGDLYLKNGRFQSAETAFNDVLQLDPNSKRAQFSLVLTEIALGRTGAALVRLDRLSETAAPGDVGLAYALAGQPRRAIDMLEPAARAQGADGRVRQNLALAYALAGDWQKARTTAAQDVSPAELGTRMAQWAALAQPKQSWDQVAALLNVRPAADPGQPVRLALAPAQAPTPASQPVQQAFASDDPAPVAQPVVVAARAAATQPVTIAAPAAPARPAAKDVPAWMSAAFAAEDLGVTAANAAPEPQEETRPVYAEAVQALVTPQSAVVRASAPVPRTSERRYLRAAAKPATFAARPAVATGPGAFAVQLGAFSSPTGVERAWAQAYQRFGFGAQTPLSTTVKAGARTLHRLSVAGFQTYADATRVCQAVRAKGGACFVRAVAGDAPVQWASRYTSGRRG